ncbi:hypothetical protein AQF98_00850 [Pedobacter sp. Hv1]|nr:hypothetical protein AQF98_00850 [Pedobacter sp. Hv1]
MVLDLLKKLNGKRLIGDPNLFSLEERIFNTVCIIAFITMCFEVPFNFFIGLVVPGFLCVFGVLFSAYLYYISRFKRRSSFGIKLFCLICNVCFAINYFYNSGVYGPNLLLFSLVFLMIVAIIPKAHFKIWLPINVVLVLTILIVEYLDPQLIPNAYADPLSKTIDFGVTYLVVVVLIYFAISYIRENYDYERILVLKKNIAIEAQNTRIIEQNSELERLNVEKNKLFSIVTHDIRSPLSSIQSYLEILTEHDIDQEERMSLEQQLLQITRDTSDMLTNLLSWSKTQMEGAHVDLVVLPVREALLNGLSIEKNIALRKGVELVISSDEDFAIIADQNMFQLVLRNLVSNAIKFTQPDGLITVSTLVDNDHCQIKIKDNGRGIDPVQQEKLFRLKASSTFGTHNERGIGLGLLLCKEYTDLQGGKIWFESNVDEGSIFYLSFKLA